MLNGAQLAPIPPPVSCAFCCNGLLCHAIPMASGLFAHCPLYAIWFPLQCGHFSCVWQHDVPYFDMHPATLHLWVLDVGGHHAEAIHPQVVAALAFTMTPPAAVLPGAIGGAFVYGLTLYYTPITVTSLYTIRCPTFFPHTTKTTDDASISPLCFLSLIVWGFDRHFTWAGIMTPWFSAKISLIIICSLSVCLRMYLTSGLVLIFSLSQDSFPSTSIIR